GTRSGVLRHGRQLRHRGARRWGGRSTTRPDQDPAVLIPGDLLRVEEFVLEDRQLVVIEVELELHGAIGHAAPALEHGDRLVHDLLKGHCQASGCATMYRGL